MSKRLSARDQARKVAEAAAAVGRESAEHAAETERFQNAARAQWVRLPYERIVPDDTQPRSHFEELQELANSIRALGGLEDPIRVYPDERGGGGSRMGNAGTARSGSSSPAGTTSSARFRF